MRPVLSQLPGISSVVLWQSGDAPGRHALMARDKARVSLRPQTAAGQSCAGAGQGCETKNDNARAMALNGSAFIMHSQR